MTRGILGCLLFLLGHVLCAQPMLESGQILPHGLISFECSSLSFPVQRDDRPQFYSQIQFQGHYAFSEKWEMRFASATGWDPTVKHGSLLAGLTYQWMQNGAWSSALSGTVSTLYGDQIIPQHKFGSAPRIRVGTNFMETSVFVKIPIWTPGTPLWHAAGISQRPMGNGSSNFITNPMAMSKPKSGMPGIVHGVKP